MCTVSRHSIACTAHKDRVCVVLPWVCASDIRGLCSWCHLGLELGLLVGLRPHMPDVCLLERRSQRGSGCEPAVVLWFTAL